MLTFQCFRRLTFVWRGGGSAMLVILLSAGASSAATLPEIRVTASNSVPACVTPERLMTFLKSRHPSLDPRFENIAGWYQRHGETWRVRWDYAFFQMALETNFLTYRQGNGRWGDVDPEQNNFAGIGTTGGGVPGDAFPDVSTGVLAQIQHLVAYSGERMETPVAPRTRLKQDDIIEVSRKLRRPVRFSDLARRWAVDRNYGRSIEWVASRFHESFCKGAKGQAAAAGKARETLPWVQAAATAPAPPRLKAAAKAARGPAAASSRCEIKAASYGGERTLLIRSDAEGAVRYTALSVVAGFEQTMAANFIRDYAPGGAALGAFETKEAALARARELCPGA